MFSVSDKAVEKIRERLVEDCFKVGIGFRILASSDKSGEVTFSVKIDIQREGDKVIESGGVKVFLEPSSAAQISNYQFDYRDEPDGGFFLKRTREAKNGEN